MHGREAGSEVAMNESHRTQQALCERALSGTSLIVLLRTKTGLLYRHSKRNFESLLVDIGIGQRRFCTCSQDRCAHCLGKKSLVRDVQPARTRFGIAAQRAPRFGLAHEQRAASGARQRNERARVELGR